MNAPVKRLIKHLLKEDMQTIEDFLGYQPTDTDLDLKSEIENVIKQMPDEELNTFFKKYNLLGSVKIKVTSLTLEITRECNMHCKHCSKGDPIYCGTDTQYMGENILTQVFSLIDDVDELIFTGGEPSLNIPGIKRALTRAKERGFRPVQSQIRTNGKTNIDELLAVCDQLDLFCIQNQSPPDTVHTPKDELCLIRQIKSERENNGYLRLMLSVDEDHETIPKENIIKLCRKPYFCQIEEDETDSYEQTPKASKVIAYKDTDGKTDIYEIDTLYVTTGGELFTDTGLSYLDMEAAKNGQSKSDTYLGCIQDYHTPKDFVKDKLIDSTTANEC